MIEITPPEGLTDPGKIHHEIAPTPSVVREIKGYFTENPEEGQFPDTEIERLRTIHQDDQEAAAMEELKRSDYPEYKAHLAAQRLIRHMGNSAEFEKRFGMRGLEDMYEHPERYDSYFDFFENEYPEEHKIIPSTDESQQKQFQRRPDAGARLARLFNHQRDVKRRLS